MGSEKGLEGRGRGKKRRLEGLEVKMTSSLSLLFFYFFKKLHQKLESYLLSFFQRHRFAIWKSIPTLVPLHITQALFLWLPSSVSKNQWSKDHSRLESTESLHI